MKNIEHIVDIMENSKEDLIHIQDDILEQLPKRYWKKLDTILGKLENLECEIHAEAIKRKNKNPRS